jgi:hypothetical protein
VIEQSGGDITEIIRNEEGAVIEADSGKWAQLLRRQIDALRTFPWNSYTSEWRATATKKKADGKL